MYERHFNLTAEPFRLSPDHHFRYEHAAYAKARAYMTYAYMRAEGFAMITGRPGTGKTTLIGDLIDSLADESVTTANLVCTQLEANDLLKMVAYSFGISSAVVEKGELLQGLTELLHRWNREQRRALLIVDEAQDLSLTAMEELRLLTNIQSKGQPLLQVFLLGQPELRELVLRPEMEQVHQRIVAASHLTALQVDETEAYIRHRLEQVGWQNDPAISRSVYPLIHKFSEGVPRRINLICSRLLLHCLVEQKHQLGSAEVKAVIHELQSEHLAAGQAFSDSDFAVEDDFEAPGSDATIAGTESHEATSDGLASGHSEAAAVDAAASASPVPGDEGDDARVAAASRLEPLKTVPLKTVPPIKAPLKKKLN